MRRFVQPTLIGALLLLISPAGRAGADVLQAAIGDNGLYAVRQGDKTVIGGFGSDRSEVDTPPGADFYSLLPTTDGWVAAGHVPTNAGQTDLLIVQNTKGRLQMLPLPPRSAAELRGQPVLLVDSGTLAGLAWVEGSQQSDLEVWAADWLGDRWGGRQQVSGRGPGSQLALTGVVLADGTWMLVWTAWDGEDDETVWSRRESERWSTAVRVHEENQVPDITPAVTAVDGGALVAWSWFDGSDYRLKTALFDGRAWTEGPAMGEKGSLYPSLITAETGAHLLYKTVAPESWTVIDVDSGGALVRAASVRGYNPARPLLVRTSEAEVELTWPSESGALVESAPKTAIWEPMP